ncbi:MAG: hypothetical protein ACNS62_19850 [Candidatus Cyclobacteriaceae bacterium M3_2C_046]
MVKRFYSLGFFKWNHRTGQFICKPTGVECDNIQECIQYVKNQKHPENDPEAYNVSQFDYRGENYKYIASCSLDQVITDQAKDLYQYK